MFCLVSFFVWLFGFFCLVGKFQPQSTEDRFSSANSQLISRIQKAREALFSTFDQKVKILVAPHDRKLMALEMLFKRAVKHLTLN